MSHKNKKSLEVQAQEIFMLLRAYGTSKYELKQQAKKEYRQLSAEERSCTEQEYINNAIRGKIYSYNTYDTYAKHNKYFFNFCRENYKCKTLAQCREHVNEWLKKRIDEGISPYTISLEKSAIAKLYQEPVTNFINTPKRERANITRSRNHVLNDNHFSIEKNKDLVDFCRATGLRRSELARVSADNLVYINDKPCLKIKGKGGRYRISPIIGTNKEKVVKMLERAVNKPVFEHIPKNMDVHSYRSDYATAIYKAFSLDLDDLPKNRQYICRKDRKGEILDKKAMEIASEALGHSRISVVADHYIR